MILRSLVILSHSHRFPIAGNNEHSVDSQQTRNGLYLLELTNILFCNEFSEYCYERGRVPVLVDELVDVLCQKAFLSKIDSRVKAGSKEGAYVGQSRLGLSLSLYLS